jgi:glycosyltransferase involved in cell wall biosynthesis
MVEKAMKQFTISVILHLVKNPPYSITSLYNMIRTILNQYYTQVELIILDKCDDSTILKSISDMAGDHNAIVTIHEKQDTLGSWLNSALHKSNSEYLLYIDNSIAEIYLKNSTSYAFFLACQHHPESGLVYSDYEIEQDGKIEEIHLLKHHPGRLRDNQDMGKVFYIKKSVIQLCGGFDPSLKYNTFYDMRLKISEKAELIHLANKFSGSFYRVRMAEEARKHNVFDYLQSAKDVQLEAENVLTAHLKRINAYLEPGKYYHTRLKRFSRTRFRASVIIPVNNRPDFISTAIESVLEQRIQDIEVIVVVNGGEKDPTIETVKKYMEGGTYFNPAKPPVRLIILDINNIGLCLNTGVQKAQGEYYIQLDSDDRLKSWAVEKILGEFNLDPGIGMVIGSYEVWQLNEDTNELERMEDIPVVTHDEWTEENGRNNLLRINGAGAPRAIPIRIIKEMGYFCMNDENYVLNYGEDYDMVLKINEKYRIARIWEPIYEVVRHKGGTDHSIDQQTIDRNDEAKDYMRLQAIKRRQKMNII